MLYTHVQIVPSVLAHLKKGKLRALAVLLTVDKRIDWETVIDAMDVEDSELFQEASADVSEQHAL